MKKDWDWANQALKEVGRLKGKIAKMEEEYEAKRLRLQEEDQARQQGVLGLLGGLLGDLEKFVRSHKDELPGETRRIKSLPSGRVGLTLYTQLEIPDPQRTIEALKRMELTFCIKGEETVNKTALQRLRPPDLKAVHVRRLDVERFFLEAKCPTSSSSR